MIDSYVMGEEIGTWVVRAILSVLVWPGMWCLIWPVAFMNVCYNCCPGLGCCCPDYATVPQTAGSAALDRCRSTCCRSCVLGSIASVFACLAGLLYFSLSGALSA